MSDPLPSSAPEPPAVRERSQIDLAYQWDLSSMFADDEAFLAALEDARKYPALFEPLRGTVSKSPESLLAFLRLDDECDRALNLLANYASRKSDEDTRVARYQDFEAQVRALVTQVVASYAWFTPEVQAMGAARVEEFYAALPELAFYRRSLDRVLARAAHTLPPEQEALLAAAGDALSQPGTIFALLNDADLTFSDALDADGAAHPVTHGSFIPLLMARDRTLRENAYRSLYAGYGQFRNTFAATLGAQAKQLKFMADARRYPSSLAAAVDANEVPAEVYTNLVEAVRANLEPLHRYVDLRKRLLGVDELRFWDLYVPVVDDVEMRFTFEEACAIMLQALAPLGEDYLAIVRQGLEQRWIDVYENPGKRSGAYSAGCWGTHPVILMNFQGTLDDVFTLVHEMGHSVHAYLSCANQASRYSDYVIFVAEVASTCNEALLMRWLLDRTDDQRERAYLVNHYLEMFRGTVYRQTMFAEFEMRVGELVASGAGATAEALSDIYRRLNEDYFGPGIVVDDQIALEWARIPHFYYNYYVYQYATGFSAAIALSRRILGEGADRASREGAAETSAREKAVADYLGFLSGGSSKPPIDLLRGAGVDMASPQPVNDALALFGELVNELDGLMR